MPFMKPTVTLYYNNIGGVDHSGQISKHYTFIRKTEMVAEAFHPHDKLSVNKCFHCQQEKELPGNKICYHTLSSGRH